MLFYDRILNKIQKRFPPLAFLLKYLLLPLAFLEWFFFHVPMWLPGLKGRIAPRFKHTSSDLHEMPRFASQWLPFTLWMLLFIIVTGLLTHFQIPGGAWVGLLLCLFAISVILGLNYRSAAIQYWYSVVAASEFNRLPRTLIPHLNELTTNEEEREALKRVPFLKRLAVFSVAWMLLLFPLMFQALHEISGFLPKASHFNLWQWFVLSAESVLKSLFLDVFEIFKVNLTGVALSSKESWEQGIILGFRFVSDLLVVNTVLSLAFGKDDPVEQSAKLWAKEAWEGKEESLRNLNRLGEEGAKEFLARAHEQQHSVNEWFSIEKYRPLTNEVVLWALAMESDENRQKIASLSLSQCRDITDAALSHLAALPELDSLDLSRTQITDEGLQAISNLKLRMLDLSYCENITDKGLQTVKQGKLSQYLKQLKLSNCKKVGDEGVRALRYCPNLTLLDLSGLPKLTDDGVDALGDEHKDLPVAPPLQRVNLRDSTDVSEIMIDLLKSYFPNIRITRPTLRNL